MILLYFILFFILIFSLINAVLFIRHKRHSNKFIEKIIKNNHLDKVLKIKKQNWMITSFRTSKSIKDVSIKDVTSNKWFKIEDKNCSGVADPFLFKNEKKYYLFFEYEYHQELDKGADLAYAISDDGIEWRFQSKIIEESFHQSFPYVFIENEEIYMLPESNESNEVRLYIAEKFPLKWKLDKILYKGTQFVDTILLKKKDVYYWFTTDLKNNNLLLLFYSEKFKGEWIQHPSSPISNSLKNNRNAGAIIIENNNYYRPAQDGENGYGSGINLYKIIDISKENYKERIIKDPMFLKNTAEIKDAIHHISILEDELKCKLIAIDGANFAVKGIKINL
ncbi:MAG: hypothetical protein ACI9SI_001342 [Polaribacter sp.]